MQNPRHCYPHFLIVGMMKCGTTTVYEHLSRHPRVVPAALKELHHFTRDFVGRVPQIAWSMEYHEMLGWRGDPSDGLLYGEASPSYIAVPQRIHAFNPDTKIIIMLRDPVNRAKSQIRHHEQKDFRVKDGGYLNHLRTSDELGKIDVVEDSMYLPRVQRFLEIFPPENVAIVSFEELTQNPQNIMDEVFQFLGLDPIEIEADFVGAATAKHQSDIENEISQILADYFRKSKGALRAVLEEQGATLIPQGSPWFERY